MEGVANGSCSAASLVDQAATLFARNVPFGGDSVTLRLAVGDLVLNKQDGRYACQEPLHGEVQISDGVMLTMQVRDAAFPFMHFH